MSNAASILSILACLALGAIVALAGSPGSITFNGLPSFALAASIGFPVLQGWQLLTLISPIFVYILLTRISGVNMLERRADKKWGDDPEYQLYKETSSSLIPIAKRKK